MKIDDANTLEEFEAALADYQYFEYLKSKGPRGRSMKEEAEYFALKLQLNKED